MPKITEIFGFVTEDSGPDDEEFVGMTLGSNWIPMFGTDMKRAASLRSLAEGIARVTGKKIKFIHFTNREDLEEISGVPDTSREEREGAKQMADLKLFDQLPQDYKGAVNHIVEAVLGDVSPYMNDSFREWQAEIYLADALAEDRKPDLKLFEIEALAFRDGWERQQQASVVPQ